MQLLAAINTQETADGTLVSPHIKHYARKSRRKMPIIKAQQLFTRSPLKQAGLKQQLNEIEFLTTAEKTSAPGAHATEVDAQQWSARFTEAALSLYGAPSQILAARAVAEHFYEFSELHDPNAIAYLTQLKEYTGGVRASRASISSPQTRQAFASYMKHALHPAYSVLNELNNKSVYDSAQLAVIFGDALSALAAHDPAWAEWGIARPKSAIISVDSPGRNINVGIHRAPMTLKELEPVFAHELGVHALRAVNGAKNKLNALPGYIDFEEGLGIYTEYALTGAVPSKAADRYIDVSLAFGVFGETISRKKLLSLDILRRRARDPQLTEEQALKLARVHVNRIFRGGNGRRYKNGIQAVFVKDKAYYQGFMSVADYINKRLMDGIPLQETLNYTFCGKFDPTIEMHNNFIISSFTRR